MILITMMIIINRTRLIDRDVFIRFIYLKLLSWSETEVYVTDTNLNKPYLSVGKSKLKSSFNSSLFMKLINYFLIYKLVKLMERFSGVDYLQ